MNPSAPLEMAKSGITILIDMQESHFQSIPLIIIGMHIIKKSASETPTSHMGGFLFFYIILHPAATLTVACFGSFAKTA